MCYFVKKQDGKYSEILIDIDESVDGPHHLQYVLSRAETVVSKILLNVSAIRSLARSLFDVIGHDNSVLENTINK